MSAVSQSAALPPRTSSAHRHQNSSNGGTSIDRDRPHRAQSTTVRPVSASLPRRSLSTASQSATAPRTHARSPSANLSGMTAVSPREYDYDHNEPARPAATSQSRRTDSHHVPTNGAVPPRSDSTRQSTGHNRTPSQNVSRSGNTANSTSESRSTTTTGTQLRRRTTIDAQTGHWDLGKTIGAGSMGKVKLARNQETMEEVAVKIVPRHANDQEHRSQAERDRAEHSKEVRTAREAAIVTLVDHPYICGMRDVVRTHHHWYMLFEYVDGGQMLDYIISHGRLKERQARKFGRQIASALDYCHRNSIVHRDLKIENILISRTGDIKIIDFGLSNMFNPRSLLKTFCGSLYFAAPELLQAKQYTGPEVDVWSFGIVLYVLVCGKVPFDDQSMPQLHAKIKRGHLEYPPWISLECKSLISRMLVTNPAERATISDVLNHGWMNKGYSGPPENYLPPRKPLQLPLDPRVIDKMTGFDFGTSEYITEQLTKTIESEEYQRAIRLLEKRNAQQPEERKRGVFENFYKRRNSATSRDTLNSASSEGLHLGNDPINAFHPLISVYYLAKEKIDREARESNPGGLAMPGGPEENALKLPDLPAPAAAYTNTAAYEMAGEQPTGGRTRARARTHGEDEVQQGLKNLNVNTAPSPVNPAIIEPQSEHNQEPIKKSSTAASILRRFSTRRHKDPNERMGRGERNSQLGIDNLDENTKVDGSRMSFSMRRARDRTPSATRLDTSGSEAPAQALRSPPPTAGSMAGFKKSNGLGRSISVNSSDVRRKFSKRGASEGSSLRPPMSSTNSHENKQTFDQRMGGRGETSSDVEGVARPDSAKYASRTKSLGHGRTESMQIRRNRRGEPSSRQSDVPEETNQDIEVEKYSENPANSSPGGFKPVFLKGVFSVSTTSNKPLQYIRLDIIRVLKQLSVEFAEIKGGFRCKHCPSIKSTGDETTISNTQHLTSPEGSVHKRKISFGGLRERTAGDRDSFRAGQTSRGKSSYVNSSDSDEDPTPVASRSGANRNPGDTSTHVQSDIGSNLALKFEIIVVKVPLLSLHGIQFKKVDGGTWQYKTMAQTILNELRL